MDGTPDVNSAVARIEALLDEFGERADARARTKAEELVRSLMEIYGSGLGRIVEILREAGDAGLPVLERLAADKLVASLLLIHGLHPVDVESRIRRALAQVERRASIRVESLEIADGAVRLRLESGSNPALAGVVESAVRESAPEVEFVEIEGVGLAPLVQISPAA